MTNQACVRRSVDSSMAEVTLPLWMVSTSGAQRTESESEGEAAGEPGGRTALGMPRLGTGPQSTRTATWGPSTIC